MDIFKVNSVCLSKSSNVSTLELWMLKDLKVNARYLLI